jgi:uncharacterized protein (TIGR00369 family)
MFVWSELLDSMVAGTNERPSHSEIMRLPSIDGWEPGRVWCEFEVDPSFIQPQGNLFGGYISALADEFLGIGAMTVVPDKASYGNSDIHVNFFRPIRSGKLFVESRVVHKGRRNIYVEAEFKTKDGELAVRANATFVVQRVSD